MSADLTWKKSSFSTNDGECVELARTADRLAARDSKNPAGPVLSFPHEAFPGLLTAVRRTTRWRAPTSWCRG